MSQNALYELYRLHLIDAALLEMKRRAGALDGGKAILQEITEFKTAHKEILERPGHIEQALKDLDAKSQAAAEKIKSLEKQLYGGSVVNAREAAGFEQEIKTLREQQDRYAEEGMVLMEELPGAQEAARPLRQELSKLAKAFEAKKQADQSESGTLQTAYKAKFGERQVQAALVSKPLMAQYDAIRQKYGGIGMGIVDGNRCGACGTMLPEKVLQSLDQDRILPCESCHRILFKVVPGS